MTGCSVDCTEVRFTSFLSSGFTTIAIVNPLDEKLVNAITVDWRGVGHSNIPTCGGLWTKFSQSSKLSLRCVLSTNVQFEFVRSVWNGQPFFIVSSQWGEIFFRKILLPLDVIIRQLHFLLGSEVVLWSCQGASKCFRLI